MQAFENDFCPGGTIILFFSCRAYKLGDDEYSASVFGIEYCIQKLYSLFPKKFPLIISAKGVGGQM